MGIANKIKKEQDRLSAVENRKSQEGKILNELVQSGFGTPSDLKYVRKLCLPKGKLLSVINQVLPHLTFSKPKKVKITSDGTAYVRTTKKDETPDTYSFDFNYSSCSIWIFNNGSVSVKPSGEPIENVKITGNVKKAIIREQAELSLRNKGIKSAADTSWLEKSENYSVYKKRERLKLKEYKRECCREIFHVFFWIALVIWIFLPNFMLLHGNLRRSSDELFYVYAIIYCVIIILLKYSTFGLTSLENLNDFLYGLGIEIPITAPSSAVSCIAGFFSLSAAGSLFGADYSHVLFTIFICLPVSNVIGYFAGIIIRGMPYLRQK